MRAQKKRHLISFTRIAAIVAVIFALALVVSACGKRTATQPSGHTPVISLFASDTSSILPGTATTIRWEVLDSDAQVRIDPSIGNVGSLGSVEVRPLATTTYTLLAYNDAGPSQRSLTIQVAPQPSEP